MKTSFREPEDFEDSDRSQENQLHQRMLQAKPTRRISGKSKEPKGELQGFNTVEDPAKGSVAFSLRQWIALIGWP